MLNDFFNIIFPRLCASCNNPLLKKESVICTKCILDLPKTNYHLDKENPINKIFWGRVNIEIASSYYHFTKGSKVQNLLHQLKYKGNKAVGEKVGELYAYDLKQSLFFNEIDYIIPVPLHLNKLKKRGYNQSESFALGLSKVLQVKVNTKDLFRVVDSKTQTKKTRYKRWENVGEIFALKENNTLKNKTILLVDDVVTTGATIEACARILLQNECKILVATIASA